MIEDLLNQLRETPDGILRIVDQDQRLAAALIIPMRLRQLEGAEAVATQRREREARPTRKQRKERAARRQLLSPSKARRSK